MGFWITLFLFAATLVISEVTKPKPSNENARPAGLGDFKFPTATEERPIPLVFGTVKLQGPNVVWYGDLTQEAVKKKVKTGLFSSHTTTTGYRYLIGIQFALCRGTVDKLIRVWIGEKEVSTPNLTADGSFVIDKPELFGGNDLGQGGVSGTVRWKVGSEVQDVVTYLEAFQDEGGATPAYRGTAFCTFEGGYIGNSTSIQPWSFEVRRLPVGPDATGAKAVNSGNDANPAYVIYEALTNDEWGLGLVDADIDKTVFNAVADVLVTEGNGFSFVLDRTMNINDLFDELQRQIDGVVFIDQSTGLWTVKLARNDFTVGALDVLSETNVLEVKEFTRGAWDDTTNIVTVEFIDRSRDYFGTYSLAQDMANIRIQGTPTKSNVSYPGVKDKTLANSLAWRDLRSLSFPLAKATLIVNRQFWDANPTDVFKWSSAALGFTDLIMRVTRINLGELANGRIELSLVEDVFSTETPSFGDPIPSGWVAPSNTLVAIPAAQSLAFEAPKAFIERDPDSISNGLPFRVWAGARRQSDGAVEFDLRTRISSDDYVTGRTVDEFMLIGELDVAITESDNNSSIDTTIEIVPDPDSQSRILDEFENLDAQQLGENLQQLILVDSEFMLVDNASINVDNIDLNGVYRGALDTVPTTHGAGAKVYLIFVGGGLDNRSFANGNTVNTKLVTRSTDDELLEATATTLSVVMANRHLKPYPPIGMAINGGARWTNGTQSLDAFGTFNNAQIRTAFDERDFRMTNETDIHVDDTALPADFPAANDTQYLIRIFDTSSGSTQIVLSDFFTVTGDFILARRTLILRGTLGVIPTSLRVDIETQHEVDSVLYEATQALSYDFPVESTELENDFNMGLLFDLDVSPSYSAPDTGTYAFEIGATHDTGDVEARINGGSWVAIITAGTKTGNLAGVTASDTIEVRVNNLLFFTTRTENMFQIEPPTSANGAYAIFAV